MRRILVLTAIVSACGPVPPVALCFNAGSESGEPSAEDLDVLGDAFDMLGLDWFLTGKLNDRRSHLGYACKRLWSALFRAEPGERLTEPSGVHYRAVIPERLEKWWKTQSAWQKSE